MGTLKVHDDTLWRGEKALDEGVKEHKLHGFEIRYGFLVAAIAVGILFCALHSPKGARARQSLTTRLLAAFTGWIRLAHHRRKQRILGKLIVVI